MCALFLRGRVRYFQPIEEAQMEAVPRYLSKYLAKFLAVASSIAVKDTVKNRGLYRAFVSHLS